MVRNRLIALAMCTLVFSIMLRWVAGSIGSTAVALIAASVATLPVMILMRCFLDPCAWPSH